MYGIYRAQYFYAGTIGAPGHERHQLWAKADTREEAQEAVARLTAGTYRLAHGEYAAPSYKVRKLSGQENLDYTPHISEMLVPACYAE